MLNGKDVDESKELVLSKSPALSKSPTPPLEAEHLMMLRQLFAQNAAALRKSKSPSLPAPPSSKSPKKTNVASSSSSSVSIERSSKNKKRKDLVTQESIKSISTQQALLVLEHFYLRCGYDDQRLKDFVARLDDAGLIDFSLIGLELSRTQQLRSQFLRVLLSISGTPVSPQSSSGSLSSSSSSSSSSPLLALTPTLVREASLSAFGSQSPLGNSVLTLPPSIRCRHSCEESFLAHGFVEEKHVGKGAFGSVAKVHGVIDNMTYAVKKIPFSIPMSVSADAYLDRVRREVTTLAHLDHPNILRYYSCWIDVRDLKSDDLEGDDDDEEDEEEDEEDDDIDEVEDDYSLSAPEALHAHPNDDLSGLIRFGDEANDVEESSNTATIEDESRSTNAVHLPWFDDTNSRLSCEGSREATEVREKTVENCVGEDETNSLCWLDDSKTVTHYSPSDSTHCGEEPTDDKNKNSDSDSKNAGPVVRYMKSKPQVERVHFVLYLQTQFCNGGTLREWLDNPERTTVDKLASFEIFREILKGVDHIHKCGIVHRDLKPANIFFDVDSFGTRTVKIGDFGLAKMLPYGSTKTGTGNNKKSDMEGDLYGENKMMALVTPAKLTPNLKNTRGVGTIPYASPEQISHTEYTFSADIYSLGIILLELYSVFRTGSERVHVISDLKTSGKLPVSMTAKYQNEMQLVLLMTAKNPEQRPSASAILTHPTFQLLDRTSAPMNKEQLEQEVAQLKQMLKIREEQLSLLSVQKQ